MAEQSANPVLYVGGYGDPADGGGIHIFEPAAGPVPAALLGSPAPRPGRGWTLRTVVPAVNPTYLARSSAGDRLYVSHSQQSYVSAYAINGKGDLELIGQQPTGSVNPAHLAVTPNGRWLLAAGFTSGHVSVLPVLDDGSLGPLVEAHSTAGSCGPRPEQSGSQPHQIVFAPDGGWILVPDRGRDLVHVFALEESGRLRPHSSVSTPPGSGPRHFCWHPQLALGYLIGELDSTMIRLAWDGAAGRLSFLDAVSMLPEGFDQSNAASGIEIAPDGAAVFGSNRGDDSICRIPLSTDGAFQPADRRWIPAGGRWPRFFTLADQGRAVWSACQHSDRIVVIDLGSDPERVVFELQAQQPSCVLMPPGHAHAAPPPA